MIKHQKDFYSGLLFMALGMAFAIGARDYGMGTASNMGPGYLPFGVGCILTFIGLLITLNSLRGEPKADEDIGSIAWKPLIYVISANILFGVALGGLNIAGTQIIPPLGLIIGVFLLVILASKAEAHFTWRNALILSAVLAVGSYLLFSVMLGLRIPVWPWFISN